MVNERLLKSAGRKAMEIDMIKKRIIILPIVIAVIVAIFFGIKSIYFGDSEMPLEINMYFFNSDISSIVAEKKEIVPEEDKNIIEFAVQSMIKSTSNAKNISVFNKNTVLNYVEKEHGGYVVDFSTEFLSNDNTKNILAVYALTKTLCQIPNVSKVKVTVEGQELIGPDRKPLGFLSGEDINIESDKNSAETKYVTLYFADKESGKLVKEVRNITITDTQPIEQYIVNEIVKGPAEEKHVSVLSSDTTVISAQTTDGTCFVNFTSSFASRNSGNQDKEKLAIYSIVNSLTELDTVKNVQFLVDGKKLSEFGTMSISDSFFRNETMIKNDTFADVDLQ